MLRRLLVLALIAVNLVVLPAASTSAATANLTLAENAPGEVLYGAPATVTLTAHNPSSSTTLYNLTYTDVLPLGVSYVPGSTTTTVNAGQVSLPDPTVLANVPTTGKTTLVFTDVANLPGGASQAISFKVQAETDTGSTAGPNPILPGANYTDASAVYANTNVRYVPQVNPSTGAVTQYTDSDTSSGTTTVQAVQVSTANPEPESELPRGVHDHQVPFSITVTNNLLHSTTGITVVQYIPAGLEFLACGGIDNTTNAAGTNPGSTDEYPGSGSLNVASSPSNCLTPTSVDTVTNPTTDARQALTGVYTVVTWTIPDLAANASRTINYLAAVPLRENTATWSGSEPTAGSGEQAANLDNNNGAETYNGQQLTSIANAEGTFTGPTSSGDSAVAASGSNTVTAVDLATQKTASSSVFSPGTYNTYTINYQTSEYRYSTATSLVDTVPTGQCPIGTANYATDSDAAECAPAGGRVPTTDYTSVAENSDGTFAVTWNLGTLPPNTASSITFPVLDRASYQGTSGSGLGPTAPTLAGDALTNNVTISGTVHGTCYLAGPPITADPICSNGGTVIYSGEATPAAATNSSSATVAAGLPIMTKEIATPVAHGANVNCATATYIPGSSTANGPAYEDGDTVCFRVTVHFPAGVSTHDAVINDFLPPNTTYVAGSAQATASNTATIASTSVAGTTPNQLTFTLGDAFGSNPGLYVGPAQTFQVTLAVVLNAPPAQGNDFTYVDNRATLDAINSAGYPISDRANSGYNLTQPVLNLTKTANMTQVHAGDSVNYTVTLTNTGLVPALNATIWDNLPSQITDCSTQVTNISDGGSCSGATKIVWTGVDVPAGTVSDAGMYALTYTMAVPDTVGAGETLINHAGVVSYQPPPANNGGTVSPTTYYPANNINPSAPSANAPSADDTWQLNVESATLTKTAAPTINGPSNATIGEPVLYTLTATVPGGTTVYSADVTDPLPATLAYSSTPAAASATVALGGGSATPVPGTFSLTTTGGIIQLAFPSSYQTAPGVPATFTISFYATVQNVAGLVAGNSITNAASFTWNDSSGTAQIVGASTTTGIVEPRLAVTKTDAPGGPYAAGATVTYTARVRNTGTSAAADVVAIDTLPAGLQNPTCATTPTNWTCQVTGTTTITWTLNTAFTLPVGGSATFTYTEQVPSPAVAGATYRNTVRATAASLDTATYPGARTSYAAQASDTITVLGPTITKSASPTLLTHGVDTTYTETLSIPANLAIPNLTVLDTMPNGMTFDAYGSSSPCSNTAGSCGADIQTTPLGTPTAAANGTTALGWWIGNVAASTGVRTITLTYTGYPSQTYANGTVVPSGATLTNTVNTYWSATSGSAPSSIPTPSAYTYSGTAAQATVTVAEPVLTLSKAVSTTTPSPGVPFTYTLTVTNTGTWPAYDVSVDDPMPAGIDQSSVTAVSASVGAATYDATTGHLSWTLPGQALAPSASAQVQFSVTLAPSAQLSDGQAITNTAQIASYYAVPASTATGDPSRYVTYGPVSASVTVHPQFPVLALTKSVADGHPASLGHAFAWQLSVTDTGPAPVSAASVTDVLPPYWTYTPGTNTTTITRADGSTATTDPTVSAVDPTTHEVTLTWSGSALGPLSANSADSITINYTATPHSGTPEIATNNAVASGLDGSGAPGNADGPYTSPNASDYATLVIADLSIVKSHTGDLIPGQQMTYTLAVHNAGPSAAADPVVTDTLPDGLTYVSASGDGWSCDNTGQIVTCTATGPLDADTDAAPITLVVDVTPAAYPQVVNSASVTSTTDDPDLSNNTSNDPADVTSVADLAIVKSHDASQTIIAGKPVTYTLTVSNNGPTADPGPVVVHDELPLGETFVSASGTDWTCSAVGRDVTCTHEAAIANGYQDVISLTVMLDHAAVPSVTNTATVSGGGTDPDPSNNTSSDTITVSPGSALVLTKTLTNGPTLTQHQNAIYDLTVHNLGPSPATDVTVVDDLPAGLTPLSAGGDGFTCTITGQRVSCVHDAPMAVGARATVTVIATVTASSGTIRNVATVSTSTDLVTTEGTSASASGEVSAAGLAFTGMNLVRITGLAALLVIGGAAAIAFSRRRRRA